MKSKPPKVPKICVLPWTHLATVPDGRAIPCCLQYHYLDDYDNVNIQTNTIDEIMNSRGYKNLRLQMLNGEFPKSCEKCYSREKLTGKSLRTEQNKKPWHKDVFRNVRQLTEADGTIKDIKIKIWDIRFSNLCNMACIMCGPDFSSKWAREYPGEYTKLLKNFKDNNTVKFIDENIKHVQEIYFAGGEPLIMDEHYYILDKLMELGKTDVTLRYNTNFLKTNHKGKDAFDYWKQWKGPIELAPSIDAMGKRAEYIRYGTKWEDVDANLKKAVELGLKPRPLITVGVYNMLHLPDLAKYFHSIGIDMYNLNMLNTPIEYDCAMAPNELKEDTLYFLEENFKHIKSETSLERFRKLTSELVHKCKPVKDESSLTLNHINFVEKILDIDKKRNLDFFRTFPELFGYYEVYHKYSTLGE